MQKASQFILTQQLLDKRYVNYERFIRKIDPKIVKDSSTRRSQTFV